MTLNEFGEEITEAQLKDLSERITKLSDEKIDELWFRCGFVYGRPKPDIIYESGNKKLRALFVEALEEIRGEGKDSEFLQEFLAETPIKDVLKNLEDIEKEVAKK